MLQLVNGLNNPVLNADDFYIAEKWSGLDELVFTISIHDPVYPGILEEAVIRYEQPYLIKAIDGGADRAKVKCQLNVDALKEDMLLDYTNGSATVYDTVAGVAPTGWTVLDQSGKKQRRTIEGEAYTPLEVIQACADVYGVAVRFDVEGRIIRIYDPDSFQPLGAFVSRELNLKEINFKGKSAGFATRLYAYGKDGLSVASVNGGKPYVEDHSYSNKVVSAYWKDERYTVPENLLADAKRNLKELAVPARSYSCSVYDLAATNPEMYGFQDFNLFSVVKLVDDIRGTSLAHQVVEYRRYPEHPERNEVTLATVAPSITKTVKNIQQQIDKPTSSFRQQMQSIIDTMAASIAGYDGGNMIITKNNAGKPNGIMIMDTDDKTTAKKVMWLNLAGITYSQNGAGGPFDAVWSFEKNGFVADWIVTGTMLASIIKGGVLTLGGRDNGNGVARVLDASGNLCAALTKDGLEAIKGLIGGWSINSSAIYKDVTAQDGTVYRVYFQPPLVSMPDSTWVFSIQKSTDAGKNFHGIFVIYSDGTVTLGENRIKILKDGTILWIGDDGHYAAQMTKQSDGSYSLFLDNGVVSAKNVPNALNRYTGTIYTKNQGDSPMSIYVQDGVVVSVNQ